MPELHPLMVRIDPKIVEALKKLKSSKRRSLAVMAEEAFTEYLAKHGVNLPED